MKKDKNMEEEKGRHVVIVGAGPGGCLTAINFARRGWQVTLIERGEDFSSVDLTVNKSWMIGLGTTGISALKKVPGLWEAVSDTAIPNKGIIYLLGKKTMREDHNPGFESFTVDRNYVTGSLLKFLIANHGSDPKLKCMFNTSLMYVDGQNKSITVKSQTSPAQEISYDLLIGADGVRSVVRNSLFSQHRNFACSNSSIFLNLKSLYMKAPKDYEVPYFYFVIGSGIKNASGFAMAGPKGTINMVFSFPEHLPVDPEMLSNDPEVLYAYFKKNFTHWELDMDFCRDFAKSRWYRTGQVKCNFYHMGVNEGTALLLGDAAHATSPALGSGMNTALADARALDEMMEEHKESLDTVLPTFSERRVKEGIALTDMSFNLFHVDPSCNYWSSVKDVIRSSLHRASGGRVNPPGMIVATQEDRSDCMSRGFKLCSSQGILDTFRVENEKLTREHFERAVGLREHTKESALAHQQARAIDDRDISSLQVTRRLKKTENSKEADQ